MGVDVMSPPARPVRREPLIPHGVLGMLIFVFCEVMFFAGLISAFLITKASAPGGIWPPYGQPRLPAEETAINTAALLASAALLVIAHRTFAKDPAKARLPMLSALALGVFFVAFQGAEWAALLSQGLTLTSSQHGAFFYLIVGSHAAHAVVAVGVLGWICLRLFRGRLHARQLYAAEVFWYFVVLVWPLLYGLVYF